MGATRLRVVDGTQEDKRRICRVIVTFYMPCVYCMYLYSAKIYEILHAIVWTLNMYLSISICVYDRYV